ncbi:hypothetical protein UNPF46_34900 [Bradyrhizobium sp. UNPF46]|nr:hypothetical protein UNPF46_34900 [Bradyrhizobium sp. UNPF46]
MVRLDRRLEATVLVRAGLGGALMNLHGRMIGVVVARRSGFAFAVPVEAVRRLLMAAQQERGEDIS